MRRTRLLGSACTRPTRSKRGSAVVDSTSVIVRGIVPPLPCPDRRHRRRLRHAQRRRHRAALLLLLRWLRGLGPLLRGVGCPATLRPARNMAVARPAARRHIKAHATEEAVVARPARRRRAARHRKAVPLTTALFFEFCPEFCGIFCHPQENLPYHIISTSDRILRQQRSDSLPLHRPRHRRVKTLSTRKNSHLSQSFARSAHESRVGESVVPRAA